MPRKQQQAVFASMGSRSDSSVSNAGMQHKREKLAREGLSTESKQDKIDKIMQNKRLTHRQKMDRIAKLKAKPVESSSHSTSVSIVRVPSGIDRSAFDSIVMKKKLPSTNLYDSGNLLLTQEEYVRGTKNRHSLPKGAKILNTPPGGSKRAFDAFMFRAKTKPNTYVRDNNLVLPMKDYKKGLRRNARVRFGTRDWKAKHKLEQDKIIKEAKKGFTEKGIRPPGVAAVYEKALSKKGMSYKQLKKSGAKLKPGADSDGDGVKNSKDCRPLDKNKQDINWGKTGSAIAKAGSAYVGKKMHERTPEGRIEKAKKKIKAIDQKEKAEYYERYAEAKKQLHEEGRRG